ncbi:MULTISPECIES: energy transducer TonB [Vibrio]|uniref:Protein TonB n=2 Tax=Vibrio TaxID=662 RepID=A0A7X4RUI6_9VIBR|nr:MULTISPECIES: energy transducer TonB [Vibrio]MBF9000568.1 energy transducer TonB [Vibrio nitrifigilis]MZI93906.1 TonB family protein [Vibrio eleionomae]
MRRLLIATPIALAVSFMLFAFMAWMIDNGSHRAPKKTEPVRFDMVMMEQDHDVQRRHRAVPPKPETPQQPEKTLTQHHQATTQQVTQNVQAAKVPSLGLDTGIKGIAIKAPSFGDLGTNQQAMPLYRVQPQYPVRALKRGIEGFVIMKFTIDESGHPTDIEVVKANPRHMFEREARRALRSWKYQPKVADGKAVTQPGQTVKLEFKLAK